MTIRKKLEEKYFQTLEENCITYLDYETQENGQILSTVKNEYNNLTVEEMCKYLEMPEWVIEWTLDLINAEETVDQYMDNVLEYGRTEMTTESKII